MRFIYDMIASRSDRPLGVGAEGKSFADFRQLIFAPYDSSNTVRRQMDANTPAQVKLNQYADAASLVGNGIALQGQIALQALADLQSGRA